MNKLYFGSKAARGFGFSLALAGAFLAAGCNKAPVEQEPAITGGASDPPVSFKPQWQANKRYVMQTEVVQNTTQQWGKQPQPVTTETSMLMDYAITTSNAPDGKLGLELEILSLSADVGAGEWTPLHFDSLNKVTPNEGQGVNMLEKVIGGRLRFLVGPDSRVIRVDGMKEFADRVENAPATAASQAAKRGGRGMGAGWVRNFLGRFYDVSFFKQLLEFPGWPEKPVRVGENWSLQGQTPGVMGMPLVINAQYTLKGWQTQNGRNCARVDMSGALSSKSTPGGRPAGTAVGIENGKSTGKAWYDPALDFPVESMVQQNFTIAGTRPAPPAQGKPNPAKATNAPMEKFSTPVFQQMTTRLTQFLSLDEPSPAK